VRQLPEEWVRVLFEPSATVEMHVCRLLVLSELQACEAAMMPSVAARFEACGRERLTEREVSTKLWPLRSSVTSRNGRPHSGSPVVC